MSDLSVAAVRVAAPARLQFDRLSKTEKLRLNRLLMSTDLDSDAETQVTASGRFVSRLNGGKRVLWTRREGRPTVLSIVDKSYSSDR